MVKLIASDIDGTLMKYGQTALSPALFGLIRRLRSAGVLFCPASGRQYHSLRQLFAPVADEVCFLCENGAVVFGPGVEETAPILSKTPMPRREALALTRDIQALPSACALVSGQNLSYLPQWPEALVQDFCHWTGNLVRSLDCAEEIPEDILKVSARCPDPAAALELLERQGVEAPTVVEALAGLYRVEELCLPLITGGEDGLWLLDWEEWRGTA